MSPTGKMSPLLAVPHHLLGRARGARRSARPPPRSPRERPAGPGARPRRRGRRCRRPRGTRPERRPEARRAAASRAYGGSPSRAGRWARRTRSRPPSRGPGEASEARAGTVAAPRAPPPRCGRSGSDPRVAGAAQARRRRRRGGSARRRPGKKRSISSPVVSLLAVRASIRPKNISTSMRATWVESTRSAGSWKVATFSESEWRSAADPALGANGSCTWTRSNGTASNSCSRPRLTSTGIGAGRRRGPLGSGMRWPIASTRGFSAVNSDAGSSSAARIALRESRIAVRESDGAATTTRCPRSASSPEVRATNSSISCRDPQGRGLTWAIASASGRFTVPRICAPARCAGRRLQEHGNDRRGKDADGKEKGAPPAERALGESAAFEAGR